MPLGYKYVERDASSQVNWAEIGKNMSDMLANENKVREEKKAAIDEASRQFGLQLANAPQGQDASARSAALEYADNASKFMRMQDVLLKSGKMKLKDYTVARQNLLDGTDQAFDSLTGYQKVFGEKMDRARTDKSAAYELHAMQKAEGFGNWAQSGFYINPTNGQVNIALKDKQTIDGKDVYTMSQNPNKVASTTYVKGLIQGQWDKFNTMESTQAWSKSLGADVRATSILGTILKTGEIRSKEDITSRTDIIDADKQVMYKFVDAENQYIDGALANPFARGSVLTDSLKFASNGKQYRFTNDENDAKNNPEAILEIINPSTQQGELKFSDEQHEASNEFMRNQARSQYTYKEEIKSTAQAGELSPEPEWKSKKKDEKKLAEDAVGVWNKVFTATTTEDKNNAVQQLLGTQLAQDKHLINLDLNTPGEITFIYQDAPARTIPYNSETITLGDWAKIGNEIHGVDNVTQVMKRAGGGDPNAKMNESQKVFTGVEGSRQEQNYGPVINEHVGKTIGVDTIVEDDNKGTAARLTDKYAELGYTFLGSSSFGTDYIQVGTGQLDKDGEEIYSAKIKIDSEGDIEPAKKAIAAYMAKNPNKNLAKKVLGPITNQKPKPEPAPPAGTPIPPPNYKNK